MLQLPQSASGLQESLGRLGCARAARRFPQLGIFEVLLALTFLSEATARSFFRPLVQGKAGMLLEMQHEEPGKGNNYRRVGPCGCAKGDVNALLLAHCL